MTALYQEIGAHIVRVRSKSAPNAENRRKQVRVKFPWKEALRVSESLRA